MREHTGESAYGGRGEADEGPVPRPLPPELLLVDLHEDPHELRQPARLLDDPLRVLVVVDDGPVQVRLFVVHLHRRLVQIVETLIIRHLLCTSRRRHRPSRRPSRGWRRRLHDCRSLSGGGGGRSGSYFLRGDGVARGRWCARHGRSCRRGDAVAAARGVVGVGEPEDADQGLQGREESDEDDQTDQLLHRGLHGGVASPSRRLPRARLAAG
mmetsp:Transcript_13928/g.27518  ORF Transcript_13928/g.27518 Transcript_13928/m.27518 type:complete len:212 (-) Transcript_13928:269-904(-)